MNFAFVFGCVLIANAIHSGEVDSMVDKSIGVVLLITLILDFLNLLVKSK
jgi:hypothetical protein